MKKESRKKRGENYSCSNNFSAIFLFSLHSNSQYFLLFEFICQGTWVNEFKKHATFEIQVSI